MPASVPRITAVRRTADRRLRKLAADYVQLPSAANAYFRVAHSDLYNSDVGTANLIIAAGHLSSSWQL
jgi:formate-dependent phosphoribosylglycinamide formyltransferase (GAR transformylase)